jgi:WD40 repeat protein
VLGNADGTTGFTCFALFAPDDSVILTAGTSEGRVQLWQAPADTARAREMRRWIAPSRSAAVCAAFAPDGSFAVVANRDRQLLVWPLPSHEEFDGSSPAIVTLVERAVESNARQVRIWADLDNSNGKLVPGTTVTMTIRPDNP